MSKKNFIRLNIDDKYLSIGNLFRVIKENSNNANTFWQSDLFLIIFNTDNIADSTVNNYCTGLRAINSKYKNYFNELKNIYTKNNDIFVPIIGKILNLIYSSSNDYTIESINKSVKLKTICNRLYSISKNDSDVPIDFCNDIHKDLAHNDLYNFMIKILFYVILERKQPIYIEDSLNNVIENNIYDTNISIDDINRFIQIQLNSGIWSIRAIKELSKQNNPFACFEMASMEYFGIISGKPRYEKAYEYYKVASSLGHPVATWAIGYLYYNGNLGCKSKHDYYLAFKYFNKSRKLKCSNAYNSIGLMIQKDLIPHVHNKTKAIDFFKKSASMGNIYAYNNLGKIYEIKKDYKTAFNYYIHSANSGDSWSANKIGDFYVHGYFVDKDLKKAFEYFTLASEAPLYSLCPWSKYNLAKLFYLNGCAQIGINKDINKAIELLDDISPILIIALEDLIYIYYSLYLDSNRKNTDYLNKINYYISKIEEHKDYNEEIATRINKSLKDLKLNKKHIILPS